MIQRDIIVDITHKELLAVVKKILQTNHGSLLCSITLKNQRSVSQTAQKIKKISVRSGSL